MHETRFLVSLSFILANSFFIRVVTSGERREDDDEFFKGFLYRKHVWESMSKPASNRAWTKLYFVIKPGQLLAYKDQKQFKQDKLAEEPLALSGAVFESATDYKKKHCFKLKSVDGGELMFRAKDDDEMNTWLENLRSSVVDPEPSTMSQSSRAQTLPPSASAQEKKKGGFFTLKRK